MPTIKTASGNPIAITDSASAPLQGLRVLGKTTQNGTPTPDAPVPLVSVGDDGAVDVTVAGKNLLPPVQASRTRDGITFTCDETGTIAVNGTATATAILEYGGTTPPDTLVDGQTYWLSGCEDGSASTYKLDIMNVATCYSKPAAFVFDKSKVFSVRVIVYAGTTLNNLIIRPMVAASEDYAYEPYKTPQPLTLSTPNGLPGVGDVCDEIDLERGVYVQRVKKTRLTSTGQQWRQSSGLSTRYTWDYREGIKGAVPMCSHYPCKATGAISETNVLVNNGGTQIYVNTTFATLAEWKAWLDANDVWLAYVLATPIETDLTTDEVLAYKALKTNHPSTTIMSNEDAWLYAAYIQQQAGFTTYWTDPKTDWKNGDHFNLDPDYERIKNNITYVQELANKVNARVEIDAMGDYTITEYPLAAFLNTIATNIEKLSKSMFLVTPTVEMPMHVGNGPGWTAEELNDIEGNLLNMYEELNRQYALVPRLDIMMGIGGINFGS